MSTRIIEIESGREGYIVARNYKSKTAIVKWSDGTVANVPLDKIQDA